MRCKIPGKPGSKRKKKLIKQFQDETYTEIYQRNTLMLTAIFLEVFLIIYFKEG